MNPVVTEELYSHHYYSHHWTTILYHTHQNLLHFNTTPPTYVQTSFWNCLKKNDVTTYVWFYMHITSFVSNLLNSKLLSLTINPTPALFSQLCTYFFQSWKNNGFRLQQSFDERILLRFCLHDTFDFGVWQKRRN